MNPPEESEEEKPIHGVIIPKALYIREEPGYNGRKIGILRIGMTITIEKEKQSVDGSEWYHVVMPMNGFVDSQYIEVVE